MRAEGIRVVPKRGWLWKSLHWAVLILTLGGNRAFLKRYYTTIGPVVGYPEDWEKQDVVHRIAILSHERRHVGQFRKGGLGSAWLGVLPVGLCYLLLPLPVGFAWCRWRFERTAYAEGIRVELSWRPSADRRERLIAHAVEQLVGPRYGYTAKLWPGRRRVRAYFEASVPPVTGGQLLVLL